MIKRFFIIIAVFSAIMANAQEKTSSPYSYFGIGLPTFNGSVENRSMEGLSITPDSIHFSFQNPAGFGALKFTTFTVGGTHQIVDVENNQASNSATNTSFDYLALGIPTGKLNFGFGIVPYSGVGYKLKNETDDAFSKFSGRGGLNKLFLSFGYRIKKGLRVGLEGAYNFGNIQNESLFMQDDIQYGTREKNRSNLSGFQFKLGAQYERQLNKKLLLKTSASYSPSAKLNSENIRNLATITRNIAGQAVAVNERDITLGDTNFNLPSDFRIGAGVGERQKWFVGAEYENIGKTEYKNTSFSLRKVSFESANVYRLGGFYIPNYDDITNYFNRITFRAGLRYQDTGLNINQSSVDEFGISFGLGLPAGNYLSNINLGVEYGKRGTTASGLVRENFLNVFIGISFNDKWFIQRKFH